MTNWSVHIKTAVAILLPFVAMMVVGGCAGKSAPARYYLLAPIDATSAVQGDLSDRMKPVFGIGPIEFPDYLDRPQIVMRTADNTVQIRQFDRWAEPLDDNFSRVLVQNLSKLLETDSIYPQSWSKSFGQQYQVAIRVYSFDIVDQQYAQLESTWAVFSGEDNGLIFKKRSYHQQSIESAGFEAYVSALNATLEAFSREMAEELRFLMR